jgi:hypothetical protein
VISERQAPLTPRRTRHTMVSLRTYEDERDLRAKLIRHGARWDPQARVWRMKWPVALRSGLADRAI